MMDYFWPDDTPESAEERYEMARRIAWKAIQRYAFMLTGSPLDREDHADLVGEVCVAAEEWLRSRQKPIRSAFSTKVYGIARDTIRQWLRHRSVSNGLDQNAADDEGHEAEDVLKAVMQRDLVRKVLATLPNKDARYLQLIYLDGRTMKEVADFMGQPLSTVKVNVFRARRRALPQLLRLLSQVSSEMEVP